jgi:hypothetical protein
MTSKPRQTAARPVQRICGPVELLQAVPYLLGFHPARSLVVVGLAGSRLVVTARLDLSDAVAGAGGYTLEAVARGGSTSAIAVVYDDDAELPGRHADDLATLPWQELAWDLEDDAALAGCPLSEALLVARGRWWSLSCGNPDCCPDEGRELPVGASAFAAAATYTGMVALPDRAALEALLEPLPEPERAELASAVAAAEQAAVAETLRGEGERYERRVKRALFAAARACDAPNHAPLKDEEVARFGSALAVISIRDALWMAIDDGRIDGRTLWRELARRLPRPHDAAPLFLYGWASWRAGTGALASIAAQRALDSVPAYTAALLLSAALTQAVNPRRMPKLRAVKPA